MSSATLKSLKNIPHASSFTILKSKNSLIYKKISEETKLHMDI